MLHLENSYLKEFITKSKSTNENKIILEDTIFYARSGGQPGDVGEIIHNSKIIKIQDTLRDNQNNIIHISDKKIEIRDGETVKMILNWNIRYKYMKMHSALHLLCSLVPFGVTGGQIGFDKSRLDFDVKNSIINKDEIELKMNILINEDHKINYEWITIDELDKKPELVRTMSVKPPRVSGRIRLVKIGNIDIQPCGGTHVKTTKEIGKVSILKIENKGKKNRRISICID